MAKAKKSLVLPDLQGIVIVQSNRVTKAKYDYTLIQERVFTWVMYHLQTYVKEVMNGVQVNQLQLFRSNHDIFCFNVPMNVLGSPSQYRDIRKAITDIAGIVVKINDREKQTVKFSGLFSSVEMPDHDNKRRSRIVTIEIRKDVAKMLIDLDRNALNKPAQYTQYMLHTAIVAQHKYTSKIYKLLCSWREKKVYPVKYEIFREWLQLPANVYPNFYDFKKNILIPVMNELKAIADIWFNVFAHDFIVKEGRKVIGLKFTILEPVNEEMTTNKIKVLMWQLSTIFGCGAAHMDRIKPYINSQTDWIQLYKAYDRCYYLCEKGEVKYPAAFITKSLLQELNPVSL